MQLIEYLMWKDLECNKGLNNIATKLGQLFNHLQPIVLFILGYIYYDKDIINDNILIIFNLIYFMYVIKKYNPNLTCTSVNKFYHLDWEWKYNFDYNIYHFIMFINILQFIKNKNIIMSILISYIILYLNIKNNNNNNNGELWCFSVTSIPLVNLFMQKILKINN
jgi:hypothetical protein